MNELVSLLGAIPSPSSNSIDIGPVTLNFYGLFIGLGVLVGVWIAQRRWAARGGNPDVVSEVAVWAVIAGLIGARVYHIITDQRSPEDWIKVWEGGLGIPGGLIAGTVVAYLVARTKVRDVANFADAVIVGVPVAQAIGRLGNWVNQEVFGGPTDLPWALEIDEAHRPAGYANESTFHPTFLYEGLWNLALAWVLVRVDRTGRLKRGMLLPLYVGGYGIGRFLIELIRIDAANTIAGIRVNLWVAGVAVVASALALAFAYRGAKDSWWATHSPDESPAGDDEADDPDGGDSDDDDDADDNAGAGVSDQDGDDNAGDDVSDPDPDADDNAERRGDDVEGDSAETETTISAD